jgi:Protein of unknown function (DUF2726)
MSPLQMLGLVAVVLVLAFLAKMLLGRRDDSGNQEVDTLAGSPTATRPLTAGERKAYRLLHRATPPNYILMAQVALARFIKVSHRTSYRAWYDKIGHRCVDFVICDTEGEVVVVIELDELTGNGGSYDKVVQRKSRVLSAAQVPVLHWRSADLPSASAAREQIELAELGHASPGRPKAPASGLAPLAPKGQTLPSPLTPENEEFNRRWTSQSPEAANRDALLSGGDDFNFSDRQKLEIERNLGRRGDADPWASKA